MAKKPDSPTRDQLVRKVRQLERQVDEQDELRRLLAELQTWQEEARQQNEQLRESQRKLAESNERYAELYEAAPVGYITHDLSGVIEQANSMASRFLGMTTALLRGKPTGRRSSSTCSAAGGETRA